MRFLPVLTLPGMKERTVAINSFGSGMVLCPAGGGKI